MKRYRVIYETRGVIATDVWVDEDKLPNDFDSLSPQQQDEILYELQLKSQDVWKDMHHGHCVNVLPVAELKVVTNA